MYETVYTKRRKRTKLQSGTVLDAEVVVGDRKYTASVFVKPFDVEIAKGLARRKLQYEISLQSAIDEMMACHG